MYEKGLSYDSKIVMIQSLVAQYNPKMELKNLIKCLS